MADVMLHEIGESKDIRKIINALNDFENYLRATNQLELHGGLLDYALFKSENDVFLEVFDLDWNNNEDKDCMDAHGFGQWIIFLSHEGWILGRITKKRIVCPSYYGNPSKQTDRKDVNEPKPFRVETVKDHFPECTKQLREGKWLLVWDSIEISRIPLGIFNRLKQAMKEYNSIDFLHRLIRLNDDADDHITRALEKQGFEVKPLEE